MVASQLILRDQKWLTLTRSIAALLSALFAGIRLKVIVDWAEVVAVDGVAEGVFEVLEVDDAAVVELEASGTPEVADRMRYIRALAVNLSRTSKEKWKSIWNSVSRQQNVTPNDKKWDWIVSTKSMKNSETRFFYWEAPR